MSRVKNITGINLNDMIIENINLSFDLAKGSTGNLSKGITSTKLRNYKKIINELETLKAGLTKCEVLQTEVIRAVNELQEKSEIISKVLARFEGNLFTCGDLKESSEILESILDIFKIGKEKNMRFQEIIVYLNNIDLIQEEIHECRVNEEILDSLRRTEESLLRELIKRVKYFIADLENAEIFSQISFCLDLLYRKKPAEYDKLIQILLGYRCRKALINISKLKNRDFICYISGITNLVISEKRILKSIIGNDSSQMINKIFSIYFKEVLKLSGQELRSSCFYGLFSCLNNIAKIDDIEYAKDIRVVCESQVSLLQISAISNISKLDMLNSVEVLYYIRYKIAELAISFKVLDNDDVIEYFNQVSSEIIDRILGYYFDLSSLQSSILSLNVYELVFSSFKEKYQSTILRSIEEIKNSIILFESQRLVSEIQRLSNDFSYNFVSFYYKLTFSSVLSEEIYNIESEHIRNFIKEQITQNIIKAFSERVVLGHSKFILNPILLNILIK